MSRTPTPESGIRLNRYLASCGIASRRKCEDLIREGRIEINGRVVLDLATRVQTGDFVRCDGRVIRQEKETTILLHKPKGFLCTRDDPGGRRTIYDLLPPKFASLSYVGRLDLESRGLLLLTNSGSLNETLTHPRHQVQKEYSVTLDQPIEPEAIPRLLEGIRLAEGLARAESVQNHGKKRLTVVLGQGYNRQIRRMFAKLGHKVRDLERVRIGSLTMPGMAPGEYKILDAKELARVTQNPPAAKAKEPKPAKKQPSATPTPAKKSPPERVAKKP